MVNAVEAGSGCCRGQGAGEVLRVRAGRAAMALINAGNAGMGLLVNSVSRMAGVEQGGDTLGGRLSMRFRLTDGRHGRRSCHTIRLQTVRGLKGFYGFPGVRPKVLVWTNGAAVSRGDAKGGEVGLERAKGSALVFLMQYAVSVTLRVLVDRSSCR